VTIARTSFIVAAASLLPFAALQAQSAPKAPDPIAPLPEGAAEPAAVEPVLPPPMWQMQDAQALLAFIGMVGNEGLDPRDYDPDGLIAAIRGNDPVRLSQVATDRYLAVAADLALGHVRGKDRQDWHVTDDKFDEAAQMALLRQALYRRDIAGSLTGLLPTHPQYLSLRAALQKVDRADTRKLNRVRLNMDRWRWLPRDLGSKYIIVNVPSFHATLVQDGVTRWKKKAIAGAIKTKTPQLTANAVGVVLNPWWEVPPSISREVAGKAGYVAVKGKDGRVQRWRQPPGPANALGQMKFVMYNEHNIYLHDTNARSRFNSEVRALSHGCVRTQDIVELAKLLLSDDNGEWTPEKVDATLKSGKSVTAKFVKPLPVYIVYFSSAALNDGTIVNYSDLYKRDDKVIAALLDVGTPKAGIPDKAKTQTKTAAR
jgi:murein L,D-transpeptidase YcbB/YkuD